jgi:hypothetical protein
MGNTTTLGETAGGNSKIIVFLDITGWELRAGNFWRVKTHIKPLWIKPKTLILSSSKNFSCFTLSPAWMEVSQ